MFQDENSGEWMMKLAKRLVVLEQVDIELGKILSESADNWKRGLSRGSGWGWETAKKRLIDESVDS